MACDEGHPELSILCYHNGDSAHPEHFAHNDDGEIVKWANEDYIHPADLKKIAEETRGRLKRIQETQK